MKVKFDLKYRQQIESGEYKVETANGRQVRIICWDARNWYRESDVVALVSTESGKSENILRYYSNGHLISDSANIGNKDLIVVIPDEGERIRKDIIAHFEAIKSKALFDNQEETDEIVNSCNEKIAYLEKQKDDRVLELNENDAIQFCFDNGLNVTPYQAKTIAKHFYELGLKRMSNGRA